MVRAKFNQAWNWKNTSRPKFQEIRQVVLFWIALNGPVHKAEMEKSGKPRIDHPRINKAVKQLFQEKLIEIKDTHHVGVSRYYVLTRSGLMYLIFGFSKGYQYGYPYGYLAKKHRDLLPEIFDLWPRLVQAGVEDIASTKLERYCEIAFQEERMQLLTGIARVEKRQLLDAFFLGSFLDDDLMVRGVSNRERWLKALISDEALCDATVEACRSRIASFSREAGAFSRFMKARGNESATVDVGEALRILKAL